MFRFILITDIWGLVYLWSAGVSSLAIITVLHIGQCAFAHSLLMLPLSDIFELINLLYYKLK